MYQVRDSVSNLEQVINLQWTQLGYAAANSNSSHFLLGLPGED